MTSPFKNILVYLDGSESSMSAAMYAVLLAKSTNSHLHAIYVVNTKALNDLVKAHIFISQEKNEYLQDIGKDAKRHINHAIKLAASKGVELITEIKEGYPAMEVMNYIKENKIDLLALGALNEIRSRRDELTSEVDRMMRTAPCPVIVTKDDDSIWDLFEEE